MAKLGIASPDKLIKKGVPAYERTNPPVTGVHIGIVVALVLVFWYFMSGRSKGDVEVTQNFANPNLPNSAYPGYASYNGWFAAQYNQLGSNAGALYGESN